MKDTMQYFQVDVGSGIHIIKTVAVICGQDINICSCGGDTFHIGASALAIPRPSLANPNIVSASASVICVTGHKEDEIARLAALRLASKFNTRVNVVCGLHIDNATKEDIDLLYKNFLSALDEIEEILADVFNLAKNKEANYGNKS